MLIRDLMSSPAVTVMSETPVAEALGLLDRYEISTLPVVDRRGCLAGIVSEADLIRDADPLDGAVGAVVRLTAGVRRTVGEVMTRQVVSVRADDDVEVAIDLVSSSSLKSLPVLLHDRVIGVISRRDLIHALATRDQRVRAELSTAFRAAHPDWVAEVLDGVVTVTGPTGDRDRQIAETLAAGVPGVIAVRVA